MPKEMERKILQKLEYHFGFGIWSSDSTSISKCCSGAVAKAGRAIWLLLKHKTTAHKSRQIEREREREIKRSTTCNVARTKS